MFGMLVNNHVEVSSSLAYISVILKVCLLCSWQKKTFKLLIANNL